MAKRWVTTKRGSPLKVEAKKTKNKSPGEMSVWELMQAQRADRDRDWKQSLAVKPNKFRQPFKRP